MRRYQTGESRIGLIVGAAATSSGFTGVSFFADTLPIVQWCGAVVAILSGAIAIALGVKKLFWR
jgi:hypothetical protein